MPLGQAQQAMMLHAMLAVSLHSREEATDGSAIIHKESACVMCHIGAKANHNALSMDEQALAMDIFGFSLNEWHKAE